MQDADYMIAKTIFTKFEPFERFPKMYFFCLGSQKAPKLQLN